MLQSLSKISIKATSLALALSTFAVLIPGFFAPAYVQAAASAADQAKLDDINTKIVEKQKEIDQLNGLLTTSSKQAQTLKSTLSTLETTRKKLEADLSLTTSKITKTTLTLEDLNDSIEISERQLAASEKAVSQGLRNMNASDDESLLEAFLNQKSLSEAFDYVNSLRSVEAKIASGLDDVKTLHEDLQDQQDQAALERETLVKLQKSLTGQKDVVVSTKAEKDKLLAQTQNSAAAYAAQLNASVAQKAQYEKELFDYESKLKSVDPSAIPTARDGVLEWPLTSVRITQRFGSGPDARRLYVSGTHGGIDLAASIGTPVYAALTGTVLATEPTINKAGCQYGKWVLIRHANGLTTIYGHMSYVGVKPGDIVATGEELGLSGKTGYATGPHLHFGVYASAGVKVVDSSSLGSISCKGIRTVAAPQSAYLDPQAYLPAL